MQMHADVARHWTRVREVLVARLSGSRVLYRLAIATLVANVVLVVTGGAVRLTASGLGCPTWPRCTSTSLVNTSAYGIHGYVEFTNRLLTFVLVGLAVATFSAARLTRPLRPSVNRLALAVLLGIPLQAGIGGITVLTHLNPWTVMLHFLASMALVAVTTVLVRRVRESDGRPVWLVPPSARILAAATAGVLAVVLYVGTVVTGSGPHAGDAHARRTGLSPAAVSQLHADLVFLLVGLTFGLWLCLVSAKAPPAAVAAARLMLAVELAQGAIGFVQYFTALPVVLVGLHMLGAALLVVAATHVGLTLRTREPVPVPRQPAASLETTAVARS